MLLHIHHTTRYAYEAPLRLSTQVLRLTPPQQGVIGVRLAIAELRFAGDLQLRQRLR